MKESNVVRKLVVTAAVVAFCLPAIASADPDSGLEGKSEKVGYADLNVENREGAAQLYRRLQHASKRVCGVESLRIRGTVDRMSESRRCYRDALDEAVARISSEALTELHEG